RHRRPDAVLTSGPPHCVHLLGLYLRRRFGIPWLADFRDPWVSTNGPEGGQKMHSRWQKYWETAVVKGADVIVENVPRACAGFQRAYPAYAHKMLAITNGYDPEEFSGDGPTLGNRDEIRIVHTGSVYDGRDPRPLLDALAGWQASGPRLRL